MGAIGDAKPRSWALKLGLGLAVAGLAAFLFASFVDLSKPERADYARFAAGSLKKLEVLEKAPKQPTAAFQTREGFAVTLKSFRGRVVVMNLWGTFCAPCIEEMPTLGLLAADYAGQPLSVVPISLDPAKLHEKAATQLTRLSGGRLSFYADPTLAIVYQAEASRGMPVTIIYAKDGRELARLFGAADWTSPEAKALINQALAE